MTEPISQTS